MRGPPRVLGRNAGGHNTLDGVTDRYADPLLWSET